MDWATLQRFAARLVQTSSDAKPTGATITRYTMYRRLAELAAEWASPPGLKVLSISHSELLCQILGFEEPFLTPLNYPEGDLLNLPVPDNEFQCILADQVLEHVEGDPYRAISESFRVVRPGGLVVHTTCFINPIHGAPADFWRFTPAALRMMCEQYGCVVESSGWGNPFAWVVIALGLRTHFVPDDPEHPLHELAVLNDPTTPIVTWVVARKKPRTENEIVPEHAIRLALVTAPERVSPGVEFRVRMRLTNACGSALSSCSRSPVYISYHWFDREGACVVHDGLRTPLPYDVLPGESVLVNGRIMAPGSSGLYHLHMSPVQEQIRWFDEAGIVLPVEVASA